MSNDSPIRREGKDNFPWCGRLIVLPTGRALDPEEGPFTLTNALSIDFPAMPDSIVLQRNAEYAVTYNVAMPDGMHQYKGTAPLEIPFKFRLHSFDVNYCKEGPLSLLRLASRLHAMVLPLNPKNQQELLTTAYGSAPFEASESTNDEGSAKAKAQKSTEGAKIQPLKGSGYELFNPVTLRLEIMYVGEDQPGIACTGYVKSVSTELFGPWLRGPSMAFNLPTAADFSFTFVHRPSHGNNYNIIEGGATVSKQSQAYAEWVKDHLYNTRALSRHAGAIGVEYRGFDSTGAPEIGPVNPVQPTERTEFTLPAATLKTDSFAPLNPGDSLSPVVPSFSKGSPGR